MKRIVCLAVCLFGLFVFAAAHGEAAQNAAKSPKSATFVVLPFSVQGPPGHAYLERTIPQLFTPRLYWKDHLTASVEEVPKGQLPISDDAEAEKARVKYGADYVIWGTATVIGDSSSLDVRVRDKSGQLWRQSRDAKNNQLLEAIVGLAETVNRDVFGRAGTGVVAAPAETGRVNRMNPEIMVNESTQKQIYLNPQFRYSGKSGSDGTRLRSERQQYKAVGMEVVDADGDGRNEIFLLEDHTLYAYRWVKDVMGKSIAEYKFPMTHECLTVRSLPRSSGRPWIIVNVVDNGQAPKTMVLTFDGKAFKEEVKNVPYMLNVLRVPPDYMPTLIGQGMQPPRLFRPGVYEMIKSGDGFTTGKRLELPTDANVLNFAYLPPSIDDKSGLKVVLYSDGERLRVYNDKQSRLYETEDRFSGSAKGIEVDPTIPGLGKDSVTIAGIFYMPLRILPMDLEGDSNIEILVNKPISTAASLFTRYRSYPNSELHALYWDGIGLGTQWKTGRMRGAVVDYAIADANNDGILDITACTNTHPGALGVRNSRAVVEVYPLDLSQADPDTPFVDEGD